MTASPLAALEGEPSQLPRDEAVGLVLAGLDSGSEWWAGRALHWVESGVHGESVSAACRRAAADRRYSSDIRARSERMGRPNAFVATADAFGPPGEGYFWARDIFFRRGWRGASFAVLSLLCAAGYAAVVGDAGAAVFLVLGAVGWGAYGVVRWRDGSEHR